MAGVLIVFSVLLLSDANGALSAAESASFFPHADNSNTEKTIKTHGLFIGLFIFGSFGWLINLLKFTVQLGILLNKLIFFRVLAACPSWVQV